MMECPQSQTDQAVVLEYPQPYQTLIRDKLSQADEALFLLLFGLLL